MISCSLIQAALFVPRFALIPRRGCTVIACMEMIVRRSFIIQLKFVGPPYKHLHWSHGFPAEAPRMVEAVVPVLDWFCDDVCACPTNSILHHDFVLLLSWTVVVAVVLACLPESERKQLPGTTQYYPVLK